MKQSTTPLGQIQYGYDRASNRTWRKDGVLAGFDELYAYDGLYRLNDQKRGTLNGTQTAITSGTFEQQWGLDSTGNWKTFKQDNDGNGTWELNQTRTANKANEITGITNTVGAAWATPTYDPAGNMAGIPNPQSLTAEYDAWNRLVMIKDGATTVSQHVYDARGYRIRKDTYTSGTLTETRHYYYTPGWQCVEERTGTLTTVERQFVWGLRYIDDLVLRDRSTANNGVINERRYAMQDGNWNTVAICAANGVVSERFAYSAYGTPVFMTGAGVVQTSSAIGFETLYAGYRFDGTTPQMYYVRNRFLLPMIGTWNRRDPIGYMDGDENLYRYAENSAPNQSDPTGLWSRLAHRRFLDAFFKMHPGYRYQFAPKSMTWTGVFMDIDATLFHENDNPVHYMISGSPDPDPRVNECRKRAAHDMAESSIIATTGLARAHYSDGQFDIAELYLAMAFHTAMDSTSPAHAGPDGWPTYWDKTKKTHSGYEGEGIETAADITPELMAETLARMELVWSSFQDPQFNFQLPVPPNKAYTYTRRNIPTYIGSIPKPLIFPPFHKCRMAPVSSIPISMSDCSGTSVPLFGLETCPATTTCPSEIKSPTKGWNRFRDAAPFEPVSRSYLE